MAAGVFPIPLIPDTNYTLSFYAKGSLASSLTLNVWGRGAKTTKLFPANVLVFAVNNQWQRYTMPFTANDRFSSIFFDAKISIASQEGYVWVDDIQLEPGSVATNFTQASVAAQLVSAARGNFLPFRTGTQFQSDDSVGPGCRGDGFSFCGGFFLQNNFHENLLLYDGLHGTQYSRP